MRCEVPGASIFYEQFGAGHDIVWVSGGGSLGSDWHRYQIPFFEPRFRNTTFDNRGIGQTILRRTDAVAAREVLRRHDRVNRRGL